MVHWKLQIILHMRHMPLEMDPTEQWEQALITCSMKCSIHLKKKKNLLFRLPLLSLFLFDTLCLLKIFSISYM